MADDPASPQSWLPYGKLLLDGGEPQAASILLEKGLLLPETEQNPLAAVNGLILLAACHSRLMRLDDAEAAYDRALHLANQALEPDHILRVTLICNWAALARSRGALQHEEELWRLALPVLQGDARFAGLLAECQRNLQELDTLRPEEQRLRESFEGLRAADQSDGKRVQERAASFEAIQRQASELAALHGSMGRHRERSLSIRDGFIMRPKEIWRRLTATGASDRHAVLDEQRCRFNLYLGDALQNRRPAAAQVALETLLWRRGIGLEIHRCANRLARRDVEVRETLDTIRFNRSSYAAMLFEAPSDAALRPQGRTKMVLEPIEQSFEYQALERRLLDRLEPQVNCFVSRPADCAELASRIPADGLLIEYWRCTWPGDRGSISASYVALLMPENRPDRASIVHLCECAAVEDTLLDYLSLLSGRSRAADSAMADDVARDPVRARELGHNLRTLLLDPLQPWTSRAKHLLVVADGLLDRLPFSTLPVGDAGYVIDHWLLSYLHTARDLFVDDDDAGPAGSPLVFSNPAYDWPGLFGDGSFRFDPLEWATREGEAIGALLGVKPIAETQASKLALMACRSPEILHIATHGLLLPARQDVAELGRLNPLVWRDPGELRFQIAGLAVFTQGLGRLSERQLPDQALRSVLAVAGVNSWLDGFSIPEAAGNGLVNAEDIAAIDLAANKLTVLSACETGLGVIGIGEGVLGLRSSFMVAGAETVVASLWSVDDQSTNELMRGFYQNLIAGKMGRAEALHEAQLAIRQQYPDDPYYWGPFVLQGAIEPLRR